jgi:hypothetical protein
MQMVNDALGWMEVSGMQFGQPTLGFMINAKINNIEQVKWVIRTLGFFYIASNHGKNKKLVC